MSTSKITDESEHKALRTGFTTGTCAAACTRAAVMLLCTGKAPAAAKTLTPSGISAILPIVISELNAESAICGVHKDSGDDPDVTNGTLICARAIKNVSKTNGQGYYDPAYPGIEVTGGDGIGLVTRKGLSCPVGHYAINPVPRNVIFREADLARREAGMPDLSLRIEISIPAGEELAKKTFNPHLGIIGGISVLGTTGIVNPMSEAALIETIRLDIRVHSQGNTTSLLSVAPGNYGERFLKEETGLSMENFIKCSNFIGDTFKMLSEEGIRRALLAGHVGKLVKVAGGIMNTHSKYGDHRMEILAECAKKVGFDKADAILPMNTTEEAADFLKNYEMLNKVMNQVALQVKDVLEYGSGIKTEVMLFSSNYGLMARTPGADSYVSELLNMES